jgi:hypothetical protein
MSASEITHVDTNCADVPTVLYSTLRRLLSLSCFIFINSVLVPYLYDTAIIIQFSYFNLLDLKKNNNINLFFTFNFNSNK